LSSGIILGIVNFQTAVTFMNRVVRFSKALAREKFHSSDLITIRKSCVSMLVEAEA